MFKSPQSSHAEVLSTQGENISKWDLGKVILGHESRGFMIRISTLFRDRKAYFFSPLNYMKKQKHTP